MNSAGHQKLQHVETCMDLKKQKQSHPAEKWLQLPIGAVLCDPQLRQKLRLILPSSQRRSTVSSSYKNASTCTVGLGFC